MSKEIRPIANCIEHADFSLLRWFSAHEKFGVN